MKQKCPESDEFLDVIMTAQCTWGSLISVVVGIILCTKTNQNHCIFFVNTEFLGLKVFETSPEDVTVMLHE